MRTDGAQFTDTAVPETNQNEINGTATAPAAEDGEEQVPEGMDTLDWAGNDRRAGR